MAAIVPTVPKSVNKFSWEIKAVLVRLNLQRCCGDRRPRSSGGVSGRSWPGAGPTGNAFPVLDGRPCRAIFVPLRTNRKHVSGSGPAFPDKGCRGRDRHAPNHHIGVIVRWLGRDGDVFGVHPPGRLGNWKRVFPVSHGVGSDLHRPCVIKITASAPPKSAEDKPDARCHALKLRKPIFASCQKLMIRIFIAHIDLIDRGHAQ